MDQENQKFNPILGWRQPINWSLIGRAVDFYKNVGFKYIEAPWIVSHESMQVTLPLNKKGYAITDIGHLVGSAEQSFIELLKHGQNLSGNYLAATPCFRDDDIDELHGDYFFKVELFTGSQMQNTDSNILTMMNFAQQFFESLGAKPNVLQHDAGYDLMLNGIEIGSYGFRKFENYSWIYGTGLAEPRFSIARSV